MADFSTRGRDALTELTSTRAGWDELWKKLRLYTYGNFADKVNYRRNLLEEVIQDAIEDAYFGNRSLPPDVDPIAFLCGTIRSKISHILEKEKRNTSFEKVQRESQEKHLIDAFETSKINPLLAERDAESYQGVAYKELCEQVRDGAGTDPSLLQLVELLFAMPDMKPGEIALEMKQPNQQVYNLLKQLRRKLLKPKRG